MLQRSLNCQTWLVPCWHQTSGCAAGCIQSPRWFVNDLLALGSLPFSGYVDIFRAPVKRLLKEAFSGLVSLSSPQFARSQCQGGGASLHYAFPHLLLCQMTPLSAHRPTLTREFGCSVFRSRVGLFIKRHLCSNLGFLLLPPSRRSLFTLSFMVTKGLIY